MRDRASDVEMPEFNRALGASLSALAPPNGYLTAASRPLQGSINFEDLEQHQLARPRANGVSGWIAPEGALGSAPGAPGAMAFEPRE